MSDQFANALNMLKYFVRSIKLKLTNKQFPCITIDTEAVTTASNTSRRLVHDVPVSVIPVKEWMDYMLPQLPEYDVNKFQSILRKIINKKNYFLAFRLQFNCQLCDH